ncbi:MAG: glycosyltransferase family 4 protein [Gemmataceae bacterium]|nr:glycosyltransferase family 4 protein [Gemmataceae bacterium]MDW8266940.1 glycosyltransferase family 1 protein [Gemmataceae bacterium]
MRIALDLLYVAPGLAGGRVYAEGLLRGLAQVDGRHEYRLFARQGVTWPELPSGRFVSVPTPVGPRSVLGRTWWEYGRLPRVVRREGCHLFHGLGTLAPVVGGCRLVLTIHDLIFYHFPASVPWADRCFRRVVLPRVASRADRIIVPSEATKRDVVEILRIPPERIRRICYGPGQGFEPLTDPTLLQATWRKRGVRPPYVVSVSRTYAHKNVAGLLRAFARVMVRRPDLQLVLVGEPYRVGESLAGLVASLKLEGQVVFTGYVGLGELRALYSGATLFAFPSLMEGFGLPMLEAMACGTPVVASAAPGVAEAVAEAGVVADARDPEAFAAAIVRVADDPQLQAELREKGLRRAATFSWERCARETLAVYDELA